MGPIRRQLQASTVDVSRHTGYEIAQQRQGYATDVSNSVQDHEKIERLRVAQPNDVPAVCANLMGR